MFSISIGMYVFRPCLVDNNPVQELCDVLRDADIGAQELRVRYLETIVEISYNSPAQFIPMCAIQAEYILVNNYMVLRVLHISLMFMQ